MENIMADKYYMSGIYSPELHNHSTVIKVLPLVRELNYKYGLKISSKVIKGLQYAGGNDALLMSTPRGFNICAVWTSNNSNDNKELRYFLYAPTIVKSRGSDRHEKSTISGKTVKIVTGLLSKYNGVPDEQRIIQRELSVTTNMVNIIRSSMKTTSDVPNRYSLDENQIHQLFCFAAYHAKIGENPNCEEPPIDRTMVERAMKAFEDKAVVDQERSRRIEEVFGGSFLAIGAYKLKGDAGAFVPGIAGVLKFRDISTIRALQNLDRFSSVNLSVVKPFNPVFSFEDLINMYPEALTTLMVAKMRMESDTPEKELGFITVRDFYDECVPSCSYYLTRDEFHMMWFVIPIEVSPDAL
jgi:hypothetical protein